MLDFAYASVQAKGKKVSFKGASFSSEWTTADKVPISDEYYGTNVKDVAYTGTYFHAVAWAYADAEPCTDSCAHATPMR